MNADDPTEPMSATESNFPKILEQIDNFRLEKELGQGSFGRVYCATDLLTERQVALKLFKNKRQSESSAEALNEARKATKLDHQHIVKIFQVSVRDDGFFFIVSELVNGDDLAKIIEKEGPLPVLLALNIAMDVTDALITAHKAALVHLDIKPSNILIDLKTGDAKLTDFGLAMHDSERWSRVSGGTLPYMAPEQVEGRTEQFDGRTDIWAFGVVLYETLTKRRPFKGIDEAGESKRELLIHEIRKLHPRPPSQWVPEIPSNVDELCLRCLEKDISRRFQSAAELHAALYGAMHAAEKRAVEDDFIESKIGVTESKRGLVAQGCLILTLISGSLLLLVFGIMSDGEFSRILKKLVRSLF